MGTWLLILGFIADISATAMVFWHEGYRKGFKIGIQRAMAVSHFYLWQAINELEVADAEAAKRVFDQIAIRIAASPRNPSSEEIDRIVKHTESNYRSIMERATSK